MTNRDLWKCDDNFRLYVGELIEPHLDLKGDLYDFLIKKITKHLTLNFWNAIDAEAERQQNNIELIASENVVSKAVMAAQGTLLTNKYAEGYPGKRYYWWYRRD